MKRERHELVERVRLALIARIEIESLAAIAEKSGVPYGWAQQFFYGSVVEPGVVKFMRLAKYLGVTVDHNALGKL